MLSQKLYNTIDRSFIGRYIDRKTAVWQELNPSKFYVENVRAFFNLPFPLAKRLCDLAVRMGYFNKSYEVICPKHGVVADFKRKNDIPNTVTCETCILMEEDDSAVKVRDRNILEYYQLAK